MPLNRPAAHAAARGDTVADWHRAARSNTHVLLSPTHRPKGTTVTKTETPHEQWVARNPLRKWRADNGMSIMATAARANVSMSAIQQWESGATTPTETKMGQLAVLLDAEPDKLARTWQRWLDKLPA